MANLRSKKQAPKLSYTEMDSYTNNTIVVGCSCGYPNVAKEWDDDLGTFYYFVSCEKCGYYWEGPIY